MSKLKKNNLNIHSSGMFFTNKPKIIKFNQNSNKTHDIIPKEINSKDNKDEIILMLKKHISILENKIKKIENNNLNKINKTNKSNILNLSIGQNKIKFNLLKPKFNIKLTKNKINLFGFLNKSAFSKKNINKNNSLSSLNNSNHKNYINTIENNKLFINSRRRNFFKNIYSNEKSITDNNNFSLGNCSSKKQKKLFTVIPKNKKKQKLFINVLRRSSTKYSTIDHGKFQNDFKNDSNSTIPKIPRKKKQHKSEIIKNNSNKFLNKINNLEFNKNKNKDLKIINIKNNNEYFQYNNKKDKSYILNTENIFQNNNNNKSFKNIKEKLENIKFRTKNLLESYFSNKNDIKINKKGFFAKEIYNNIDNSNNNLDSEENNNKELFKYNYK